MSLLQKILAQPDNQPAFAFMKPDAEQESKLNSGENISGFDEGGVVFFEEYAADLPVDCKWILGGIHNILVNPETGQIFAFQCGRFTFAFRCDFQRSNINNCTPFQTSETLDARVDITALGPCWALLNKFNEDEQEQLKWAYQLSQQTNLSD